MKSSMVLSLSILLASSYALHAADGAGVKTTSAEPTPSLDQAPPKQPLSGTEGVDKTQTPKGNATANATTGGVATHPPRRTKSATTTTDPKGATPHTTSTATPRSHGASPTKTAKEVQRPTPPNPAPTHKPSGLGQRAAPSRAKLQARINKFPKDSVKGKKLKAFINNWKTKHPGVALWGPSFRLALDVELTSLEVVVVSHTPLFVTQEPEVSEPPAKELPSTYPAPPPMEATGAPVCKCGPYPAPAVSPSQSEPLRDVSHASTYNPDRAVVDEATSTPNRRSTSDPFFSQLPGNVFTNNLPFGNLPNYGLGLNQIGLGYGGIGQNGNGSGLPSWYPAPFATQAQNQFRNPFVSQLGGGQPQLGGFQPQISNGLGFGQQGGAPALPPSYALNNGNRPNVGFGGAPGLPGAGFGGGVPTIAPFQGGGLGGYASPILGANYQQPIFSQIGGGLGGYGAAPLTMPYLGQYGGGYGAPVPSYGGLYGASTFATFGGGLGLGLGTGIGQNFFSGSAPAIQPFLGPQPTGSIYNGGGTPAVQPFVYRNSSLH